MTTDHPCYGTNLEICDECKKVAHRLSLESLILIRDERPNFNHIHDEGGHLIVFSSAFRESQEGKRAE